MGKKPFSRSIACSPGPSCSTPGRPKPGPPPRNSFIPSTTDPIDNGRNETNNFRQDQGHFGHISSEDISAQDAGYDADVEVVRPYAIEEPDDETDQTPTTSAPAQSLLDSAENWQKELVNSLRGLYCDSDSNDTHPLIRPKRGRKRKPDTSMAASHGFQGMQEQPVKDREVDTRVGSNVFSPKRRRKKSAHAMEDTNVSHGSLLASDDASTGSSSAVFSTSPHRSDKLDIPRRRELSTVDGMDID